MKQLTLGEMAAIEELGGISLDQFEEPGVAKAKAYAAMVMVVKKRTNPEFTFEDALETPADEVETIVSDLFGNDDPKEGN